MADQNYQVVVIGSGLVGSAIAHELSKYDLNTALIEKEQEVALGVSRASSSIVHPGFRYWKPGTLRALAVKEGIEEIKNLSEQLDFPYETVGELIVAWDEAGIEKIETLKRQGETNGLTNLRIITADELKEMEPNVTDAAISALYSPNAGISSSFECAIALAESAEINNVNILYNTEVLDIIKDKNGFILSTTKGKISSQYIINAAGLFTDEIAQKVGSSLPIKPERGQEFIFDKNIGSIVNHMVFPAKGSFVIPTVHGNIMVGTTKEVPKNFRDNQVTAAAWDKIFNAATKLIPSLPKEYIIRGFAGIRPQPAIGDISIVSDIPRFISACTGSPGIQTSVVVSKWIIKELKKQGIKLVKRDDFIPERKRIESFASMTNKERENAISANPLYGHVICRCETVTEAEIIEAIRRGARTIDGVKYRTRAGMGRCQGGFCGPRIARILSEQLNIPMNKVQKNVSGTFYVAKKAKELILEA